MRIPDAFRRSNVMRAACKALPVLALVAFWLPTLGPLTQPGKMTYSHDGVLYLLRAFQLDTLARQGVLWPRWLPGLAFGYGYPLFNHHPALSLHVVLILHRVGLSLLQSWNMSLALGMLTSGLTMFLWARSVLGRRGAFVAAVAYMLAPYQLYNVYWRGNIAEALTLPLLPLGMWAALCVTQERRWRYALMGALTYAAILLMHPAASLVFTLVLLSYMLTLIGSIRERRALALQLASIVVLGLGVAAFFLAPAYLEKGQVQMERAIASESGDFRHYFLSLGELFAPAPASDPLLINPSPPRSLGCAPSLLAAIGALVTWWSRARVGPTHKRHVIWASLALIGAVAFMLPLSEPVWPLVPLLPFIQFPMRFLGVGSLLVSLLAGAGVAVLDVTAANARARTRGWTGTAVWALCGVMLAAGALPWTYPPLRSVPDNPDQAFSVGVEESTQYIGATTFAEYLPVTVQEIPTTSPFVQAMRAGQPFLRWDAPGARILDARDDGLSADLVLESDVPIQVVYRAFYFPGWQARLDGKPIALTVAPPFGLMAMNVPAGRHTLAVRFGSTPLRTASEIVSLIAALVVAAIWIFDWRSTLYTPHSTSLTFPGQPIRPSTWLGIAVLGVALLALKLWGVDRYDTPLRWRRLQNGQLQSAMYPSDAIVAEHARLLGYDVHPQRVAAGDVVSVDLYWMLNKSLPFMTAVRLVDDHGLEWSYKEERMATRTNHNPPPASQDWPVGMYADVLHTIQVLPGTPPGNYWLIAVPFTLETLEPLPINAGQPAPGGYPGMILGRLEVVRPSRLTEAAPLDLPPTEMSLSADLAVVGYSQDQEEAKPGQTMLLVMGWQARRPPQADYTLRLELVAADGRTVMQQSLAPGGEHYPTSRWMGGETIRSQILAHIPGRTGSGQHYWRVTLLDDAGAQTGQAVVGELRIAAPQRVFVPLPVSHQVNTRVGGEFMLIGFDAPLVPVTPGQAVRVILVWQATGETDQNYKVFVHLLDAGGRPVAQSDAVPANWTRPTSGWQVGEFVLDRHTLDLKDNLRPGEYRLVAGMYETESGQRLPVAPGGDVVELGKILVSAPAK